MLIKSNQMSFLLQFFFSGNCIEWMFISRKNPNHLVSSGPLSGNCIYTFDNWKWQLEMCQPIFMSQGGGFSAFLSFLNFHWGWCLIPRSQSRRTTLDVTKPICHILSFCDATKRAGMTWIWYKKIYYRWNQEDTYYVQMWHEDDWVFFMKMPSRIDTALMGSMNHEQRKMRMLAGIYKMRFNIFFLILFLQTHVARICVFPSFLAIHYYRLNQSDLFRSVGSILATRYNI